MTFLKDQIEKLSAYQSDLKFKMEQIRKHIVESEDNKKIIDFSNLTKLLKTNIINLTEQEFCDILYRNLNNYDDQFNELEEAINKIRKLYKEHFEMKDPF